MDILSSDLLWSFFNAALQSYKCDTLVRPFPPGFKDAGGEKDFDKLLQAALKIPQLNEVDWRDQDSKEAIHLLTWVLQSNVVLKFTSDKKLQDIQTLVGGDAVENKSIANFIFEIDYTEDDDEKFRKRCGDKGVFYAYHGSKAENFYSILRTGLRNNLNKVSLYGEGIYLSSDLRVSMTYSPASKTWDKSLLGDSLSCVAVCEVIDHPDVKCSVQHSRQSLSRNDGAHLRCRHASPTTGSDLSTDGSDVTCGTCDVCVDSNRIHRSRSFIKGSEGGQIPDKYFVVRNDDLLRVKYLLVHAPNARKGLIRQLTTGSKVAHRNSRQGTLSQLVRRHQFTLVMLVYLLVLAIISLFNSRFFAYRQR